MQCKQCNKELVQIEGKESKVFCSDKCRKAFNRRLTSDKPTPDTTSDSLSVPTSDKPEQSYKRIIGQCSYCGRKITPEVYGNLWDSVQCCYNCTAGRNNLNRNLYPADLL